MVEKADGTELRQVVKESAFQQPSDWSPDGKYILYVRGDPGATNIWAMPVEAGQKPFAVVTGNAWVREGHFSPDGKWITYTSRETGRDEVYITAFPNAGPKWQVSRDGGHASRWTANGKTLLFWKTNNLELVKVPVDCSRGMPRIGVEQPFVRSPVYVSVWYDPDYAVASDGRVLVETGMSSKSVTLVINWPAELKR